MLIFHVVVVATRWFFAAYSAIIVGKYQKSGLTARQ